MRNSLLLITIVISSCTGQIEREGGEHGVDLTLPGSFSYLGRNPQWGNSDDLELIMDYNDRRSNLDSAIGDIIADTLTLHLAEGSEFILDKKSAITRYKNEFGGYVSQKITINAAIPVRYTDIGHTWVYSWILQDIKLRTGESVSNYLHEDFRIVNGKIREIYQFKREPPSR